jgi:predicted amidophosphoribosyltransferase
MPQAKLSLALPEGNREVEMVYLHRYGSRGDYAPVDYLHWVRVGASQPLQEDLYFRGLPRYTKALARLVEAKRVEVVLSPWSTRPEDARPYRERIGMAVHASADWTHRFRSRVRSGLVKDCDKVYDSTRFEPPPHIGVVSSVLMVDDAVSGGNTACAVLRHLLNAGFPRNAEFGVIAPLLAVPP